MRPTHRGRLLSTLCSSWQLSISENRKRRNWLVKLLGVYALALALALPFAQSSEIDQGEASKNNEIPVENAGAAIEVDGRPVLAVYARVGGFTPAERADAIQQRIVSVGKRRSIP